LERPLKVGSGGEIESGRESESCAGWRWLHLFSCISECWWRPQPCGRESVVTNLESLPTLLKAASGAYLVTDVIRMQLGA
jgi:hypothetical protein